MALPTLAKTWEFKTNHYVYGGYIQDEWAQYAMCDIKDSLCDFIPRLGAYASGTFTFASPTVTYTATGNIFDSTLVGDLVGKNVRIAGATTPGNDGEFTITAQTANTLQWSNASGAAEALAGSLNVRAGDFTVPWVISHTGTTTVAGTKDDGVDRLAGDPTRLGGGTGNVGYWVIKNTVTGSWWSFSADSDYTGLGDRAARGVIRSTCAPNEMLVPTSLSVPPNGTTLEDGSYAHTEWSNAIEWWFYDLGPVTTPFDSKLHVMMSSDGQQTRLALFKDNSSPLAWIDGIVLNPHPAWASASSTPAVTSMYTSNALSNAWHYSTFNDAAKLIGSEIDVPAGHGLSPTGGNEYHRTSFYATSEGYGDAAGGQNIPGVNLLSGAYDLYPIGLSTSSLERRGRLGQLPDLWWTGTDVYQGWTFPDAASRQFIAFGDLVLPWDGSIPEMI
jgi:hypothetical protein